MSHDCGDAWIGELSLFAGNGIGDGYSSEPRKGSLSCSDSHRKSFDLSGFACQFLMAQWKNRTSEMEKPKVTSLAVKSAPNCFWLHWFARSVATSATGGWQTKRPTRLLIREEANLISGRLVLLASCSVAAPDPPEVRSDEIDPGDSLAIVGRPPARARYPNGQPGELNCARHVFAIICALYT